MIAVTVVANDALGAVAPIAAALARAVDEGAAGRADELSAALLTAARADRPTRVPTAAWLEFVRAAGRAGAGGAADHLIGPDACARLMNLADVPAELRAALAAAAAAGAHLLQIPVDAE